MTTDWHDDVVHYKYDPLPDEPRHRKKKKKVRVRSDHKHDYEDVVVIEPGAYTYHHGKRHDAYHKVTRCKTCGRVGNAKFHAYEDEIPKGMRVFRIDSFLDLFDKYLPDSRKDVS